MALMVRMAVFLVALLVMIFWIWRVFFEQMNRMITNIKGIVLILSFRKIEKIPHLKEDMIKNHGLKTFV
jgi:hypothetical protein